MIAYRKVVHVWWADATPGITAKLLPGLGTEQRLRVSRVLRAGDRDTLTVSIALTNRFVRAAAGSGSVPRILRTCTQCGHPTHGRPRLTAGPEFSLSRTVNTAALAFADVRLGLDMEDVRREIDARALATVCTPWELAMLAELDPAGIRQLWTFKEALGKALGIGLIGIERYSRSVDLPLPSERWETLNPGDGSTVSVRSFALGTSVGTVVIEGPSRELRITRVDLFGPDAVHNSEGVRDVGQHRRL